MSYRLLIPTVRSPVAPSPPSPSSPSSTTRSPRLKPTSAKLIRSRSGSASLQSSPDPAVISQPPPNVAAVWIGKPFRFDIVQDTLELEGYQMYAVEKWVVERTRAITVLTVYTGNPQHKITVTALSPSQSLLPPDARTEWEKALHHLRRDGARPKQTPHGVLMVTSLANFRSDYTIVQIPNGDFLAAKERLYTNINLSRMGCSGRSALTLEEPSETTKERFRSTYLLPDSQVPTPFRSKTQSHSHARPPSISTSPLISASLPSPSVSPSISPVSTFAPGAPTFTSVFQTPTSSSQTTTTRPRNPFFNATVLELVKLVQAALAICGMFPLAGLVNVASSGQGSTPSSLTICELDGLLCDVTVEGLQRWVAELGERCVGVEPMERVADPTTICALLSLVLVSRNKLATVSSSLPKDPFLYPHAFIYALSGWAQNHLNGNAGPNSGSHFSHGPSSFSPTHSPRASLSVSASHGLQNSPTQSTASNATSNASNVNVYLTQGIYSALCDAQDHNKVRHAGRRAILSKLDDFTTGLRNDSSEESGVESATESDPVTNGTNRRGTRSTGGSGRGIGGRGGQLLMSGIENLASGFVGRTSNSGPATITAPSLDLGTFIKAVVGRNGDKDRADKDREKDREREKGGDKRGAWDGDAPGVGSVGGVAGSLRGLWSGRVEAVVRLRNKVEGRQHEPGKSHDTAKHHDKHHEKDKGRKNIYSDPEDGGLLTVGERTDGGKSGSTGTEDELAFGGAWSGRMQKKLEMWTGSLPKNKSTGGIMMSAESSSSGMFPVVPSDSNAFSGTKQQRFPAVVVSGDTGEEEELLSSGQVSPISESRTHNPFMLGLESAETSSVALDRFAGGSDQPYQDRQANELSEHDKRVHAFLMRRPGLGGRLGRERESRVSSWSDPVSAREEGERGKMADDYDDEMEGVIDEGIESEGDADVEAKKRVWKRSIQRRHSFHDTKSFRDVHVLKPEWMRIDVELCGQLLVMRRRDTHLRSVLACLEHITDSLSSTNASLRSDYHSHHSLLAALASHTQLLSQIESARGPADAMAQQVQALSYESHQFRVDELWHSAAPSREKVLALREKVFGMGAGLGQGGRRYVKGGKGRYNRVQWTLDGRERMVDVWGRTESEGEEEKRAGFGMDGGTEDEEGSVEEEGEAVEHTAMKPVWLLRFFTSWGARWGSSAWKGAEVPQVNNAPSPSPSASTST
ncbi:hypothetical protein SERLADRAFT_435344 [Serpula lacrymans var. lacrymans S7.9]|uniref:STB6-like N-terminal domain-containing protein n=1 Tax=Serpula lacrymans var. lacrymans (strain S7.9) TaxID=578457 RepID=F8NND7_SERL9|nr:uncharacterized protein SERLADRAFT_435344 [Serpula lacrymans var. lacrymans S7.9]EGO27567.1 hypothetical protein SERLADRAFT_435344 [Serpula lacrymans var. lacrymans S7.9]